MNDASVRFIAPWFGSVRHLDERVAVASIRRGVPSLHPVAVIRQAPAVQRQHAPSPNLNTGFGEELDLERESAKFRDAWHYVWVAPDVLAQRPAVSAETGRAA